jgi:hypothetical protein
LRFSENGNGSTKFSPLFDGATVVGEYLTQQDREKNFQEL